MSGGGGAAVAPVSSYVLVNGPGAGLAPHPSATENRTASAHPASAHRPGRTHRAHQGRCARTALASHRPRSFRADERVCRSAGPADPGGRDPGRRGRRRDGLGEPAPGRGALVRGRNRRRRSVAGADTNRSSTTPVSSAGCPPRSLSHLSRRDRRTTRRTLPEHPSVTLRRGPASWQRPRRRRSNRHGVVRGADHVGTVRGLAGLRATHAGPSSRPAGLRSEHGWRRVPSRDGDASGLAAGRGATDADVQRTRPRPQRALSGAARSDLSGGGGCCRVRGRTPLRCTRPQSRPHPRGRSAQSRARGGLGRRRRARSTRARGAALPRCGGACCQRTGRAEMGAAWTQRARARPRRTLPYPPRAAEQCSADEGPGGRTHRGSSPRWSVRAALVPNLSLFTPSKRDTTTPQPQPRVMGQSVSPSLPCTERRSPSRS